MKAEEESYVPIPKIRDISQMEIEQNYSRIKDEVAMIIETEMERIYDTPELARLLVAREIDITHNHIDCLKFLWITERATSSKLLTLCISINQNY